MMRLGLRQLLATVGLVAVFAVPAGAADVAINPKATYLHICSESALNAVPIVLADLGIVPGETIQIEALGDWDNGPGGDTFISTIAVFSASATLLPPAQAHRVPDAIAAGPPVGTAPTFFCGEVTDIPEDFRVASAVPNVSVTVVVPAGATHLFVSPGDHLFEDNSDPDGDYGIRITEVPVPVKETTWGRVKGEYRGVRTE